MGLDSVEIVMFWEESLGVAITDEEAAVITTPREATDLIAAKLGAVDHPRSTCLTLRAFNRIRNAISSGAGVLRRDIRPEARLRELVPRRNRRSNWSAVQQSAGFPNLPGLGWGAGLLFSPITVADLARVGHYARTLKQPDAPWTRSQIREVVRIGVTEICGARDFSDDDGFIEDIGVR